MKHLLFSFVFIFFSLLKISATNTTPDTIVINENDNQVSFQKREHYFFSKKDFSIAEIASKYFIYKDSINLHYLTGQLWIKFVIKNNSSKKHFVLFVSEGHMAGFYLYKPTLNGYKMTEKGAYHPGDGREVFSKNPSFLIDLEKGETKTYYLKLTCLNEVVNFQYIIRDIAGYAAYIQTDYMIMGFYYGALLLIIAVNLFYFFSLKDKLFLIYAFYVMANFSMSACFDGFEWLLISNRSIANHVAYFSIRAWPDLLIFFTMSLVNLKKTNKTLTKTTYVFLIYHGGIMSMLELTNAFNIMSTMIAQWELINVVLGIILVVIILAVSYKDNKYIFKYYLIGFGSVLICSLAFTSYAYGGSDNYMFAQYGIKAGAFIEILSLSFATARRFKITEQDKQKLQGTVTDMEMKNLRLQMNPHFIFNVINSIQYFILYNEQKDASNYLAKFSRLMRSTLENSRQTFITIEQELESLQMYIQLEALRFEQGFDYELDVETSINQTQYFIPPMLLQPYVENSIWYGLLAKGQAGGKIRIKLTKEEKRILCSIEDNGIGRVKSQELQNHTKLYKSLGTIITQERLETLSREKSEFFGVTIVDLYDELGNSTGTRVEIHIPLITDDEV